MMPSGMRPPNIVLPPDGKAGKMGQTDVLELRSISSILLVPPFPGIDPRATRIFPETVKILLFVFLRQLHSQSRTQTIVEEIY
jgi:hypothetical protein